MVKTSGYRQFARWVMSDELEIRYRVLIASMWQGTLFRGNRVT